MKWSRSAEKAAQKRAVTAHGSKLRVKRPCRRCKFIQSLPVRREIANPPSNCGGAQRTQTTKEIMLNRKSCVTAAFQTAVPTLLVIVSLASRSALATENEDTDNDPAILTFSTVGDSRQDPATPDPTSIPLSGQDAIWLQNTKAFSRILRSVESQRSHLLFFNGDMIMGYGNAIVPANPTTVPSVINSDLVKFYQQYAFWRGMVAGIMESGTYVVPVAGNHEVQWKAGGKKAQAANENAWRANMGDLILDTNRFSSLFGETPTYSDLNDNRVLDGLGTDQSKLSYSFDFHGAHFAIINTDPVGNDAHAPVNWLASDLQSAAARGIRRSFVFGHKPAFTYYYGVTNTLPATLSGLDNDATSRDAFWSVIERFNATYFCGHEHIFNMMQPTGAQGGRAWQVLVGSGGSPFEASPMDLTAHPATDRTYAWATVTVYRSGKAKITAYGFGDDFGMTRILNVVTLH
jgi:hypothetical protein